MKLEIRVRDLERQMATWQKLCCDLAEVTAKRFAKIYLRMNKFQLKKSRKRK